jgi:hypothetical protein
MPVGASRSFPAAGTHDGVSAIGPSDRRATRRRRGHDTVTEVRDGPVHCWTMRPLDGVDDWDPDREPARFADSFGHVVLELFVRLRARGRRITIGPEVRHGSRVVVVLLEELVSYDGHVRPGALRRLARASFGRSVVGVRADLPLGVAAPAFVGTEVMPNQASIVDPVRQRWLPLLPQRGLLARDPDRGATVAAVTCKGFEFNLPPEVRDGSLTAALDAIGVQLHLDGDPASWPDFRRADVALCMRRDNLDWDDPRHLRKPATKLVNAWAAGAIPLVAPQAGYLELARPGEDALVVTDLDDVVDAVRRLAGDADLVRRLQVGGAERAAELTTERVLDAWEAMFDGGLPGAPVTRLATAVVVNDARVALRRVRRG